MKQVKIGNGSYQLMESVNDINDRRFIEFKAYLLQSLEGIDRPLFKTTMERAMEHFNAHRYIQAWGEFDNYRHAIEYEKYNDDALSKCFALICIEDGENQMNVDGNFLQEKLDRLHANGLTRGMVEESVRNFILASPLSFGSYSLMMEEVMMKLDATSLTELMPLPKEKEKESQS